MERLPGIVEWEITGSCDLNCRHCHRFGAAPAADLPEERMIELADRIVASGVRAVALSGGEPTLSPHLWGVANRLKVGGIFVSLITNGRAGTDDFAMRCRDLDFVWISLDGPLPVHDALRGRGSFSRLMRTADRLAARGVPFGCMTTLLRPNRDHLEAVADLVVKTGAASWQIQFGLPNGREPGLFLSPEEAGRMGPALERLRDRVPRLMPGESLAMLLAIHSVGFSTGNQFFTGCFSGCLSGRGGFAINPAGRLRGCACLPDDGAGPFLPGIGDAEAARILAADALRGGRHQDGAQESAGRCRAMARRIQGHASRPGGSARFRILAKTAALCTVLANWTSCSPSRNGSETPATLPAPVPPAEMKTEASSSIPDKESGSILDPDAGGDAMAAGMAPGVSRTNAGAPAGHRPGMKPEPWKMPRCCMMHVLQPDCVCDPPPEDADVLP